MRETSIHGASVELTEPDFDIVSPLVDRPLAGGFGHLIAEQERAILSIVGVGTFAVEGGRRVCVQPERDVSPTALAVFLHGTVTALVLAQRGQFALHATVVEIGGTGIALAGAQRAGKSTTALRLAQLGHSIVTDDVSPLALGDPITVVTSERPIHVHHETAAALQLEIRNARPIQIGEPSKFALPFAPPEQPIQLGAVVVLEQTDQDVPVELRRAHGSQAQWLIAAHTYRLDLLFELWQAEMFLWACEIAGRVPVYTLTRPPDRWTVAEVVTAIESIDKSDG